MAKQILMLLKRNGRVKRGGGLRMKRTAPFALTFIVTILIGMIGISRLTAQQAAPTKTKGRSEKTVASYDFGPFSVATAAVNPLNIDPKHPLAKYMTKPASRYNREKVEVLARSITFPPVISQGEDMMRVKFPTAAILCLDAAYYAGRVQGLIWAMDRNTIEEYELYWIIDDAYELFESCLNTLLLEAFAGQNRNRRIQVNGLQQALTEQIEMIQENLRKARHAKIKAADPSVRGRFREG